MDYELANRPRTRKDKEHFKIYGRVFNSYTMKNLNFLANRGIFKTLDYPISTGKEADVFRGTTPNKEYVAIKIYRVETGNFKNMWDYIDGDPRFRNMKRNRSALINEWCKKEFRNLADAYNIGIRVPKPHAFKNNILVMDLIGVEGKASPMLKDVGTKKPKETINEILSFVERLFGHGLVHADISAFNVLMKRDRPYLIDMGQAVNVKHPRACEFLRRDLYNLEKFARKLGVKIDHSEIYSGLMELK